VLPLAVAITVLALCLRWVYFAGAQVDSPLLGDILEYFNYAWNLVHHGVFSSAAPAPSLPPPDAYRSPGYPLFLALFLSLAPTPAQGIGWAQLAQMMVGTAVVPLTIALARQWLAPMPALLAGLVVALWPHLVVFSSTLLSETLFGFLLLAFVLAMARASARSSRAVAVAGGLAGALAWLVNPVALFLPPLAAGLLWLRGQRGLALACVLAFLPLVVGWSLRNAAESAEGGARLRINLVQGSYPLFLRAMNDRYDNEIAAAYVAQVEADTLLAQQQPRAAAQAMLARFGERPLGYLRWYAVDKPWLLWDWSVRIGWGDVYFLRTWRSPYERIGVLRAIHAGFRALNPFVFLLAVLAAAPALARCLRARGAAQVPFALAATALLCVYVTAVHAVLQAEPRYAVAYRPFEVLLAASALASAWDWWRARRVAAP
jgi:hypothetical protein